MNNEKINEEFEILERILYYLNDYAEEYYGVIENYKYNDLINAIADLTDYKNGYIQEFNDMGTSARCYYIDTCDILDIDLESSCKSA